MFGSKKSGLKRFRATSSVPLSVHLTVPGTPEERKVVEYVNRFSKHFVENIYKKETPTDVKFEVDIPNVMIGDDVTVTVTMKNTSDEARSVSGRMSLPTT